MNPPGKTTADLIEILNQSQQSMRLPDGEYFNRENFDRFVKNSKETYYYQDKGSWRRYLGGKKLHGKWRAGEYGHESGQRVQIKSEPQNLKHTPDKTSPDVRIKPDELETDPRELVQSDRKIRVLVSERDEAKRKYKALLDEVELIEKRYDTLCAIKESVSFDPIEPNYKQSVSESIAVAQLSDIHVGEKVDPETVNGLNEFNPDICDKRVFNYFQNLLRLIDSCRRDSKIETLFLSLTGDNITGYIHEELMESNYMSPTEEVRFAKRLIIRGIEFLLNHGKFSKIFIQTNFGNHGRTTKRTGYTTAYKNSYDYMLYCDMADYFKNEKKIEFNISKSHICYSPAMFGKIIRTMHGDTFSYAGGIGGLSVPLIKYIHRLDQQCHADMSLVGHWHQRIRPLKNCLVNGSIIGINGYAQGIGCVPEPPMQNLILLDKSRGFTLEMPVFCD